MGKQRKTEAGSRKNRLEKELASLLPEIEEEGLLFLLKQSNTIIHNQRAARLNREIEELNTKNPAAPGGTAARVAETEKEIFDIVIERSKNGKTYYFIVNGRKHFLDVPETRKIVTLCYRPETKSAALKCLYEFFINERDEILLEHGIKNAKSSFFNELFNTVRANFSLES